MKYKHQQSLALAIKYDPQLLVFEGTIRSSKTVTAIEIFALKCLNSSDKTHLISAKDNDSINNNILHSNGFGLLDKWGKYFSLVKDRIGSYYIKFKNANYEDAKILLAGYSNTSSWKKILGGTIGNIFVDEVNIASETFIDECFARQTNADKPFMIWTLNGDNPDHYVYRKYINRCKPLLSVPNSILKEMNEVPNEKGWYYYHWMMEDNPSMTPEKIDRAKAIYPINSYPYKVKILGERGRAEGVIFAEYLDDSFINNDIGYVSAVGGGSINNIYQYTIGIDLGNNAIKRGTIVTISGFTRGHKEMIVLDVKECVSTEVNALVNEITDFIIKFYNSIPNKSLFDGVYVDGYGAIEVIMNTLRQSFRSKGCGISVGLVNKFGQDNGRRNRLDMLLYLISSKRIYFRAKAKRVIVELSKLVYAEDGLPLDTNQLEMDYYDSLMYSASTSMNRIVRNV